MFLAWEEAFSAGPERVGGKGWNLGRLARYGFRVPAGGVLTASVYGEFIAHNGLQERIKRASQAITLENCAEESAAFLLSELREAIGKGAFPGGFEDLLASKLNATGLLGKPLAVRSSGTCEDSAKASFAGIHDSFLNVLGL